MVLGNESTENRNSYTLKRVRDSQYLWKHKKNTNWEEAKDANQNLLRGSKAISDKIDWGAIVLPVTADDLKALNPLLSSGTIVQPNLVYHIYKNRRGRYTDVKLWCSADLGICRVTPLFLTDNNFKVIQLENYKIIVEDEFEVK